MCLCDASEWVRSLLVEEEMEWDPVAQFWAVARVNYYVPESHGQITKLIKTEFAIETKTTNLAKSRLPENVVPFRPKLVS